MRLMKTRWLNSLSVKVVLAYIAGAALSVVLIVLVAVAIVISQGDILSGADVADAAKGMAEELRFDSNGVPAGFDTDEFEPEWIFDSMKQETAYRVLDESGNVVLSSAAGAAFWPDTREARRLDRGRFQFDHAGIAMRGATEPVERHGRIWYFQLAVSTRFLQLMYRAFALPFTGAGITLFSLVLLFVFGACTYVTLRYALKPLREISDSAAAISPRSLHARLPADAAPTEIAPLVDSFNRVLGRLEQGYRIQQEFLATAAHELKTPLALIRAQIELMDADDDRRSLLNDIEHMARQVQQLLHLAEASEGQNYHFASVDVQEVAKEAADYLQRLADASDVRVAMPGDIPGPHWQADRGALFTLLKNMLENAIQHAPRGTEVRVEVSASEIAVCDRGPGVNQQQLLQIFTRFWRGAHRRDHGAGLGLAICQEIALAHGWTLSAHNANPGLRLSVSLPASGR